MSTSGDRRRNLTAGQRGQIVQRVIVDGWTAARAAEDFRLPARVVEAWVEDHRRRGMASLRRSRNPTFTVEMVRLRLLWPFCAGWRRISHGLRRIVAHERPAQPVPLHRSDDDRRGRV
jgi:hypothetical protein